MKRKPVCPRCYGYMLDIQKMPGWKQCVGCSYAEDSNGNNKLSVKKEELDCSKCTTECGNCVCKKAHGENNEC